LSCEPEGEHKQIDIHMNSEEPMRTLAKDDADMRFIKWLYEVSVDDEKNGIRQRIDININDDEMFSHSFSGYQVNELGQWLYDVSEKQGKIINIHSHNEKALRDLSNHHNKSNNEVNKTIKWLYSIMIKNGTRFDIHANNEEIFINFCLNNNLEMAKWIYELSLNEELLGIGYKINIHANNDHAYRKCFEYGMWEIVEWLMEICRDYGYRVIKKHNKEKKISIIINIRSELAKLLKKKKHKQIVKVYSDSDNKDDMDSDDFIQDYRDDEHCMICLCDRCIISGKNLWVRLDCSHRLCLVCFVQVNKCPYRCKPSVNLDDIKLLDLSK